MAMAATRAAKISGLSSKYCLNAFTGPSCRTCGGRNGVTKPPSSALLRHRRGNVLLGLQHLPGGGNEGGHAVFECFLMFSSPLFKPTHGSTTATVSQAENVFLGQAGYR